MLDLPLVLTPAAKISCVSRRNGPLNRVDILLFSQQHGSAAVMKPPEAALVSAASSGRQRLQEEWRHTATLSLKACMFPLESRQSTAGMAPHRFLGVGAGWSCGAPCYPLSLPCCPAVSGSPSMPEMLRSAAAAVEWSSAAFCAHTRIKPLSNTLMALLPTIRAGCTCRTLATTQSQCYASAEEMLFRWPKRIPC